MLIKIYHFAAVALSAALIAIAFNLFLIPQNLLSGGVSGISMILGYMFTGWNIGLLYLLINLPLLIWGWVEIGRYFILLSTISVALTTWFIQLVPVNNVAENPILSSVFGGVLVGIASGITFRIGGSSGGFDILGSILTRKKDFPLGPMLFALNAIVILGLGYVKDNWELALNSMLSIYITSRIIDMIHTSHIKVTVFIVTSMKDELLQELMKIERGVTIIKTQGAYSQTEKDMLMTVTTRYELVQLQKIIREVDPKAFVNIVETIGIMGQFRR